MVPAGPSLAPIPEFSSIGLHLSVGSMTRPFLQAMAPGCPFHYGTFLPAPLTVPLPRQASQQCPSSRAGSASETPPCFRNHSPPVSAIHIAAVSTNSQGPRYLQPCPSHSKYALGLCSLSPPAHSQGHLRALLPSIIEAQGLCFPAHLPTVSTGAVFPTVTRNPPKLHHREPS